MLASHSAEKRRFQRSPVQARRLTIVCAQNGLKICQKDSNILVFATQRPRQAPDSHLRAWRSFVGGGYLTTSIPRGNDLSDQESKWSHLPSAFFIRKYVSRCLRVSCLHDGALQASAAALLRLRIQPPAAVSTAPGDGDPRSTDRC